MSQHIDAPAVLAALWARDDALSLREAVRRENLHSTLLRYRAAADAADALLDALDPASRTHALDLVRLADAARAARNSGDAAAAGQYSDAHARGRDRLADQALAQRPSGRLRLPRPRLSAAAPGRVRVDPRYDVTRCGHLRPCACAPGAARLEDASR